MGLSHLLVAPHSYLWYVKDTAIKAKMHNKVDWACTIYSLPIIYFKNLINILSPSVISLL